MEKAGIPKIDQPKWQIGEKANKYRNRGGKKKVNSKMKWPAPELEHAYLANVSKLIAHFPG
jgi:hypothetical protein